MENEKALLTDPEVKPTNKIIAAGLGGASAAYNNFLSGLNVQDISLMEWRYYNDGKAWLSKGEYKWTTPRGANKVKPLFWLSIWEGFFKTAFFFSEKLRGDLQNLPLSKETKELIANTKPMGKTMRFLPVVLDIKSEKQLADVYMLAEFKKAQI
ncbi:MAG: DUF3788 domain-containing protein [Firmicutes bacterium]|nr:DUF3788 domain-containing protein [Bacillota bacterium]